LLAATESERHSIGNYKCVNAIAQGRLWERQHSSSQLSFGSFQKSLPHLLPRQAFSFWPPDHAESGRLRGDVVTNPSQILLSVLNSA
ncbi:hypothetical protein, partial [Rhizobium sophoriradicis]|uniref:hypothetical protein n=1 Tax=Rhizobium sophoriradicis TaxID=1535245 RepID=UPI001AEFFC1B